MSETGALQARVNLGWASEHEKVLLESFKAQERHDLDDYLNICEAIRKRREAELAKQWKAPSWLRPMGPDDYIHHRRMCQERESFEEQRERVLRMTK